MLILFYYYGEISLDYDEFFEEELKALKDECLYRTFRSIDRVQNMFPKALESVDGNDREVEIWCSNDYLNMSQNPEVLDSCIIVINKLGTGSGGTRNISGTSTYHVKLEQTLAELHNKEAALVFPSAYTANQATISTLCKNIENIEIFSDRLNHASLIDIPLLLIAVNRYTVFIAKSELSKIPIFKSILDRDFPVAYNITFLSFAGSNQ